MSCPHGNHEQECDLCDALDAVWDKVVASDKANAKLCALVELIFASTPPYIDGEPTISQKAVDMWAEISGNQVGAPPTHAPAPEDARDAARWRKLRAMNWNDSPLCVVVNPRGALRLGTDCPSGDRLDAAIDSAMCTMDSGSDDAKG